jgi:hypothetical protein
VVVQAPASVYAFLSLEVLRRPGIMSLPESKVQNLPDVVPFDAQRHTFCAPIAVFIALRPEDPCLQAWGEMAVSSLLCHTACIPQGLRKSTPVERNRRPRFQRTCQPVTASSLWVACLVRRVRPRNPPASAVGRANQNCGQHDSGCSVLKRADTPQGLKPHGFSGYVWPNGLR